MKIKTISLFFLISFSFSYAQEFKSKGDEYYYSYSYEKAIEAYKKQMSQGKLMTNKQLLNLADAYFYTKEYKKASDIYLDINKKDSIISNHQFNKMLQSLSKTSEKERVKAFLNSKSQLFSNELMENADFNYEILTLDSDKSASLNIVNSNINTPQADFSPTFYKDRLLFSSGRSQNSKELYEPSGEAYLDIYVGKMDANGTISQTNPFSLIPKSNFHKSTPYYAENNDRIFYVLSNTEGGKLAFDDNGKNSLAIGMAYGDGTFRFLLKDLSTSFYYPFFDEATSRLYFSADFEDGYGGTDIYYVNTNNGQIMSSPINAGPRINSPGNEIAPYIYGNSMYFSSDVFYGLGGMDVYKTNIEPNGTYSVPINVGKGINSSSDDFGLILKEDEQRGLVGYFSSNRPGGKGNDDIYGFSTKENLGLKTFAIRGKVVNLSSKKVLDQAYVKLLDKDGNTIKETATDQRGNYRLEVPWHDEITVQASKGRHSVFSATYTDLALIDVQESPSNIGLAFLDDLIQEKENKKVIKFKKFYFDKGKSTINPNIANELDKVVYAASRFPEMKFNIESHTNSLGSSSYNKTISQKRADVVKNYLLKHGVSPSNILSSTGYGEEKIINNCINGAYCLEFLHNQNVRTYVEVANYDQL